MLATDFSFPVFAVILGAVLIIILISYYFKNNRVVLRALGEHEKQTINKAQNKQVVKLHGKAKFVNELLVAPLSSRQCIYYQVLVEERGKNSWRKIAKETAHQDFFIQVGDEIALIKSQESLKNTRIHLVKDHRQNSGWQNDATARLEAFLKKHGSKSTFLFMNRRLRYREGIIANQEHIAVLGVAQWKSLSEPIEGYPYSKILTIVPSPKQKMIITDDPKALKLG